MALKKKRIPKKIKKKKKKKTYEIDQKDDAQNYWFGPKYDCIFLNEDMD